MELICSAVDGASHPKPVGDIHLVPVVTGFLKMIGVGALVAKELLGDTQVLLEPFRYSRYAEGRLHPVSNSPYPWS